MKKLIFFVFSGLMATGFHAQACDQMINLTPNAKVCFDYNKMTTSWASYSFTLADVLGDDGPPYYSDDRTTGEDNRRFNTQYSVDGHLVSRNYEGYPFSRNPSIPAFYKALPIDYAQNGYIRGLLIGRDFVRNQPSTQQSILSMVNAVPMTEHFKRNVWDKLNKVAINILNDVPDSRVYVVSGVLYDANLTRFNNGRVVDSIERKVAIPDAYFQAFYVEDTKRMYSMMIPRLDSDRPLKNYVIPVDEIERLSGYNFFSWVDDTTEITQERSVGYIKPFLPHERTGEPVDLGKAILSIFN